MILTAAPAQTKYILCLQYSSLAQSELVQVYFSVHQDGIWAVASAHWKGVCQNAGEKWENKKQVSRGI